MNYAYVVKASYGNDSIALIQWAFEQKLNSVAVLYNDTGWASRNWNTRVSEMELWAQSLGFDTHRTKSIGMENLVRQKKSWPRQGIQFCTQELKIAPSIKWLEENDPQGTSIQLIGIRREESANRAAFPEFSVDLQGRTVWAPLVAHTEAMRNELLERAGVAPLPHRSMECFPCINSNRQDLRELAKDLARVEEIAELETSLGFTSKGKPRTMFRPYRYMGATGIKEIIRWAECERGEFSLDDGSESPGCEAGWCGL